MSSPKVSRQQSPPLRFHRLACEIAEIGKGFYSRGWAFGTSGNLSAVVEADPLCLAITASGLDKGCLVPSQILAINSAEEVMMGQGRPSSEAAIHVAIVRGRAAGAVFHTHSVWSTLLSEKHAGEGGVKLKGYEMLKGLENVRSHEHSEWLPILDNSQDMKKLSAEVLELLERQRLIHGFLLRGHGLYTWGATPREAKRHVEILEFLIEVVARSKASSDAG
jgi:methylthioribulose-1-phosphate dehydratase